MLLIKDDADSLPIVWPAPKHQAQEGITNSQPDETAVSSIFQGFMRMAGQGIFLQEVREVQVSEDERLNCNRKLIFSTPLPPGFRFPTFTRRSARQKNAASLFAKLECSAFLAALECSC